MISDLPQVFCKDHKESITHLNISETQQHSICLCNQCPKSQYSITLQQAFEKGQSHIQQLQQAQSIKQNQSAQLHKTSQIIKDHIVQQQEYLKKMESECDSIILGEELQIDKLLFQKQYGNFTLKDLESYAKLLVNVEKINKTYNQLCQQKLSDIFEKFFQSFLEINNEIFIIIQRLGKKITDMGDIVKTEIMKIQENKNPLSEKFDSFDFFSSAQVLVIVSGETISTYNTREIKFQKIFSFNTDHKKITSIRLDQKDNLNQTILTSGIDQLLKIWNKYSNGYRLERQFMIGLSDVFRIIQIPRQQQIMTCSNDVLISWSSQSGKQLQTISEKKLYGEILCIEINQANTYIICQTQNYFYIWNNIWDWNLVQRINCQNFLGFSFRNNFEFITFQNDDKINLWGLKNNTFIEQSNIVLSHKIKNAKIYFNQDENILACINDEECQFFQIQLKDRMKLHLLTTISGNNIKLCFPQFGEYFVLSYLEQFSIKQFYKQFQKVIKNQGRSLILFNIKYFLIS